MTAYTPDVLKQIELPAGGLPRDATVTLRLIASDDLAEGVGYSTGDNTDLHGVRTVKPTTSGLATFGDVRPNSGTSTTVITAPANTVYEVVTKVGKRPATTEYIAVPDGAGPYYVADILTDAPASLTSSALAVVNATLTAAASAAQTTANTAVTAAATAQTTADGSMVRVGCWVAGIGNSIELGGAGSGGGPFGFTRPSNSSAINIACGASAGDLSLLVNRGIGGDWIGGIGVLAAPAAIGDTTVTITATTGTALPYTAQSVYFEGYTGGNTESALVHSSCTSTTTPTRLQSALTKAHAVGTYVYWGVIGRFNDTGQGIGAGVNGIYPDVVHFHIGTNDTLTGNSGLSDSQFTAAFNALDALAKAVPGRPLVVWDTILPRINLNDNVVRWNGIMRTRAAALGSTVCDVHRVMVGATGVYRTASNGGALTADGTHLNQQGAELVAAEQLHTILELVGPNAGRATPFCASFADPYSALPDGTFQNGLQNSGIGVTGVPTGWTYNFGGAGTGFGNPYTITAPVGSDLLDGLANWCTITIPAGANGTIGFKYTVLPTAGTGGSPLGTPNALYPGWSAGDVMFAAIKLVAAGAGWDASGHVTYTVQLVQSTGFTKDLCKDWVEPYDSWLVGASLAIDAGVTSLTYSIKVVADGSGSACTLKVAQPTLYNRTAMAAGGLFA